MKERFSNELGNDISIRIEERELDGVSGIFISIAGPASNTELHITHAEATMLQRLLDRIL